MRRKDREVSDISKMLELLGEEEVLRLALADEEGTYIVPVNYGFGFVPETGELAFYIHGAAEGRKAEVLKAAAKNGSEIPFEIDGRHRAETADSCDASYFYMSVMGHVKVEILEGDARVNGLNVMMNHIMPADGYHYQESVITRTMVCKLSVTQWSCKEHK